MNFRNLDLKDRKILFELEMNARISFVALGKKVGLSKQVVKYRIERLEKENLIQEYTAFVDSSKLGKTIYLIYLKLVNLSSTKEKEWIKRIEKNPYMMTWGKNIGYWDLTIGINCESNQEFDKVYKQIVSGKQKNIKDKLITSQVEGSYFNTGFLHGKNNLEFQTIAYQDKVNLDEIDLQILNLLAKNCRMSLLDLSEKVKLSPNAVKYRIKQLEEKKVIFGYKTKINYEKLGYLHFRVFIHVNNFTKELYDKIKNYLKTLEGTESISRYIGHADIDFRCYTKNLFELYQLISKIRDKFVKEIIEMDSMPIFGWERIRYYKE